MALYNGICELIERDAFLIHWLNKISPPGIDHSAAKNPNVRRLLDLYRRYRIDVALFDITTDLGVPVIFAAVRDPSPGRPKLYVSMRA